MIPVGVVFEGSVLAGATRRGRAHGGAGGFLPEWERAEEYH